MYVDFEMYVVQNTNENTQVISISSWLYIRI